MMKKVVLALKGLLLLAVAGGGLLLSSCSKEELAPDQTIPGDQTQIETRAAEFHWKCQSCKLLNAGWRLTCSACGGDASKEHANLVMNFMDNRVTTVKTTIVVGGGGTGNPDRIQLPNLQFPIKAPEPWYEKSQCVKYYNDLKTLYYYSNAEYAAGVDFGWFRTTRVLFPGETNLTMAENVYDKWLVGDGRQLRGPFGSGIKDASKAALNAFKVR